MNRFKNLNGWQRLWAVLSILYIIPVVAVVVVSFPNLEEINSSRVYASLTAVADYRKTSEPDFRWEGAYSVRTTFYRDLSDKEIIERIQEKWGGKVNLASIDAKYQAKVNDLTVQQSKSIGFGVLAWLIPVISVYLLGLALAWIMQGFRKSQN